MTFWPHSLFGRMVVIFSSMLVLSYILAIILFLVFFTRPIALSTATYLGQQVVSVQVALSALGEKDRVSYLSTLQEKGNIFLFPIDPRKASPGNSAENGFQRQIAEHLRTYLKQYSAIRFQFDSDRRIVWVQMHGDTQYAWLGVALSKEASQFPNTLKAQFAVIILLTITAAALIAFRLNKPIRQLATAARLVGEGKFPEKLEITGPKELRDLSRTFNAMVSSISKLSSDRNLMLAGISHDLRTPLARMRLAVEMLGDKTEPELRQGLIHDLEDMERILGQFIAYTREENEEISQLADINELICDIAEQYKTKGETLNMDLAELPKFEFKPVSMRRLLINLIDNAIYYAHSSVKIRTRLEDHRVSVCVLDRGPGIEASQLDRLCRPFARQDQSRSEGLRAGLGLAIVKRIATEHHAELQISNRDGGGLQVCMKLSVSP